MYIQTQLIAILSLLIFFTTTFTWMLVKFNGGVKIQNGIKIVGAAGGGGGGFLYENALDTAPKIAELDWQGCATQTDYNTELGELDTGTMYCDTNVDERSIGECSTEMTDPTTTEGYLEIEHLWSGTHANIEEGVHFGGEWDGSPDYTYGFGVYLETATTELSLFHFDGGGGDVVDTTTTSVSLSTSTYYIIRLEWTISGSNHAVTGKILDASTRATLYSVGPTNYDTATYVLSGKFGPYSFDSIPRTKRWKNLECGAS